MALQPAPSPAPVSGTAQPAQQQQQGPQADNALQRSIQAAQQAAKPQVPCIDAAIAELMTPLPHTSASLSHDPSALRALSSRS